ncbi:bromodomain and WD repeat-containing protein 1-like [Lampetra fluviatilis]
MSPWDLEPIPDDAPQPALLGSSVAVTECERVALHYRPAPGEWGEGGSQRGESARIARGLETLLSMEVARELSTAVDVRLHPSFLMEVGNPISLSTIVHRLHHLYYRRRAALLWDLRSVLLSALRFFSLRRSPDIHGAAKTLAPLLLEFVRQTSCDDIRSLCSSLQTRRPSEPSDVQDDDGGDDVAGPSSTRRPERGGGAGGGGAGGGGGGGGAGGGGVEGWTTACRALLDSIFRCPDSEPFRTPVDLFDYPVSSPPCE